jgi:hypothetical protein
MVTPGYGGRAEAPRIAGPQQIDSHVLTWQVIPDRQGWLEQQAGMGGLGESLAVAEGGRLASGGATADP